MSNLLTPLYGNLPFEPYNEKVYSRTFHFDMPVSPNRSVKFNVLSNAEQVVLPKYLEEYSEMINLSIRHYLAYSEFAPVGVKVVLCYHKESFIPFKNQGYDGVDHVNKKRFLKRLTKKQQLNEKEIELRNLSITLGDKEKLLDEMMLKAKEAVSFRENCIQESKQMLTRVKEKILKVEKDSDRLISLKKAHENLEKGKIKQSISQISSEIVLTKNTIRKTFDFNYLLKTSEMDNLFRLLRVNNQEHIRLKEENEELTKRLDKQYEYHQVGPPKDYNKFIPSSEWTQEDDQKLKDELTKTAREKMLILQERESKRKGVDSENSLKPLDLIQRDLIEAQNYPEDYFESEKHEPEFETDHLSIDQLSINSNNSDN